MPSKIAHAYPHANIFLPNGLMLDRRYCPTGCAIKILIDRMLTHLFLDCNPSDGHRCSSICAQPTQCLIGFPNTENVRTSCPPKDAELVEKFEKWMSFILCEPDEEVTLQTMVVEFLPCSRVLEVLSVSFYLWCKVDTLQSRHVTVRRDYFYKSLI